MHEGENTDVDRLYSLLPLSKFCNTEFYWQDFKWDNYNGEIYLKNR